MKLASILIVLIFNLILWEFVKATPIRKGLARQSEKDFTLKEILNNEAESSVNPQRQKDKETLNPKLKNTEKDTERDDQVDLIKKSEYEEGYYRKNKERMLKNSRNYYERNKEKVLECKRNYREQNKEKIKEYLRNYTKIHKNNLKNYRKIYYEKNKETIMKRKKIYNQNNKEKRNKYMREYRQRKKSQSNNNEGTSFVNPQTGDFTNKGKLPIVCEEEGNLFDQVEECNNVENEKNQIEVEEPNKILEDESIPVDLNKKIHSFDLNEKPDVEELEEFFRV